MAGYAIWSWHRWVWAACYAVGLFAFFVVLMPMPFAWDAVAWDLAAWIGHVYLAYAIGAVVAWLLIDAAMASRRGAVGGGTRGRHRARGIRQALTSAPERSNRPRG